MYPHQSQRGRRSAVLIAGAAVAAVVLSSCSSSGDTGGGGDGETTSITIMSSMTTGTPQGDQLAKNIAAFEDETGITVDVQDASSDDLPKAFEAASLAGSEADIVIQNYTPTQKDWLADGLVADVSGYVSDWGLTDKLQSGAVEFWSSSGDGMAGLPFIGFNWPIWYNMDLLNQAGVTEVPATFDDLLSASAALRDAGIQPFALGGKDWTAQNFVTWVGQQYVEPADMESVFSEGAWCEADVVKGLDLLTQMRDDKVFIDNVAGYTADDMSSAFFTGQAAMMPSGSWSYTAAPTDIAENTVLGGFPSVDGGVYDMPSAFQGHSAGFYITPNGEEKIDAIEQFFTYLYTPDVLKGWVSDASQVLDVDPSLLEGASSSAPLTILGAGLSDANTSFLLLPDSYLPANTDWGPLLSQFLGETGTTGADLCQTLEAQYQN